MQQRRRFKQTQSLELRLVEEVERLREAANLLDPGPVRDAAIRRARQMEAASHVTDWVTSSDLRPPK